MYCILASPVFFFVGFPPSVSRHMPIQQNLWTICRWYGITCTDKKKHDQIYQLTTGGNESDMQNTWIQDTKKTCSHQRNYARFLLGAAEHPAIPFSIRKSKVSSRGSVLCYPCWVGKERTRPIHASLQKPLPILTDQKVLVVVLLDHIFYYLYNAWFQWQLP